LLPDDCSVAFLKEMEQQLGSIAAVGRPPLGRIIQGAGHLLGLGDEVAGTGRRHRLRV